MLSPDTPVEEAEEKERGGDGLPASIATETGEMLLIPGGEFTQGNDHGRISERYRYQIEAPARRVKLRPFYMDRHEVTNSLYRRFCDSTGRGYPRSSLGDPSYFARPDYPVINVSWEDAKAFAQWAGKRLPTESEWERAARGDDSRLYPWGNQFQPGFANLQENKIKKIAPVGSFPKDVSPYGVMDMAGNVFEWVEDRYRLYPGNPASLPDEEKDHRVIRGGGFLLGKEIARTSNRGSHPVQLKQTQKRDSFIGFRCSVDASVIVRDAN